MPPTGTMPDLAGGVPGSCRTCAGEMPDDAGDMPHFGSCLIERLYTVYFEQFVPGIAKERKKIPVMPHLNGRGGGLGGRIGMEGPPLPFIPHPSSLVLHSEHRRRAPEPHVDLPAEVVALAAQ